jgi:arylsulfatase A-like enzyme
MTRNHLQSSALRGALFGALMLSTEEAANLVVNQPALSSAETSQILLWYAGVMALLGLVLSPLKQPLAHLLGLIAAVGGFIAGGKIAEELWWRDHSQWMANTGGFFAGFILAAAGLWLSLRLTKGRPTLRLSLTTACCIFLPAFRAMNINAFGSPLSGEALRADGVLLLVTLACAALVWRCSTRFAHRINLSIVGATVVIGGTTAVVRGAAVDGPMAPAETQADRPDVLLVVIDTLRADHIGVYGHPVPTTPNLDRFARSGLRYTKVASPASWTLPSFGAFATGRYPSGHGAGLNNGEKNTQSALDSDVPTLAEHMSKRGYRTGAIVTNPYLKQSFGISRGFDSYSDALGLAHLPMFVQPLRMLTIPVMGGRYFYRPADLMVSEALDWWDSMAGGPRFLMLHLMDPHDPYNPPKIHKEAIGEPHAMAVLNEYDQEIHFTDTELSRLLDHVGPEVLTIVTSDHGDTFGEHDDPYPQDHWPMTRHGHTLYQELLHVPLMIRGPGITPGVIDRPVRSFDVVPTILAIAGAAPIPSDGQALFELTHGNVTPSLAVGAQATRFGTEKRAARLDDLKLIETQWGDELYNLANDPGELNNLAALHPEDVERLRSLLPKTRAPGNVQVIDEETQRQLESLGYMQ